MTKLEIIERFKLMFPEFASVSLGVIDICYGFVETRIKKKIWKSQYDEGFLYLMAHYVKMRTGGKDGGAIEVVPQTASSKSIGKLSIGYSDPTGATYANAGELALTVYGRHFFDISKFIKPTGMVAGGRLQSDMAALERRKKQIELNAISNDLDVILGEKID